MRPGAPLTITAVEHGDEPLELAQADQRHHRRGQRSPVILSDISVKRPVFASVISLLLVAFGLVSFDRLSLRSIPTSTRRSSRCRWITLARRQTLSRRGSPRSSRAHLRHQGIEFISRPRATAPRGDHRVLHQSRCEQGRQRCARPRGRVQDNLPEEADPPEVEKVDSNDDVIIWQNLSSDRMSVPELTDYAERYLTDQYSALDGVARVRIGGGQSYAMRVWLDRKALAARGGVGDVESALRAENVELPAGSLQSDERIFKARVERNFKQPEDFAKLVLARGERATWCASAMSRGRARRGRRPLHVPRQWRADGRARRDRSPGQHHRCVERCQGALQNG